MINCVRLFSLISTLLCFLSVISNSILFCKAQPGKEKAFLGEFNQQLAMKYKIELRSMDKSMQLQYINILGQLAFYARIYRLWIKQPSTSQYNFVHKFPRISFSDDLHQACIVGFKACIDAIWSDIKARNTFLFTSDIYDEFIIRKSEIRRLIHREMFDFDFSAIYILCWMTMNQLRILETLPFCDIQPMKRSMREELETEAMRRRRRSKKKSTYVWPARALTTNLILNDTQHITLGMFDTVPFRCAKSSFCADACDRSPCEDNGACIVKSEYNEDLVGMHRNFWNVSCGCKYKGFVYRFDVNKCVDINECMYINCQEDYGENWECANTLGSYKCICKLGYMPVKGDCVPIEIHTAASWFGPAFSFTDNKFSLNSIISIFGLILLCMHIINNF